MLQIYVDAEIAHSRSSASTSTTATTTPQPCGRSTLVVSQSASSSSWFVGFFCVRRSVPHSWTCLRKYTGYNTETRREKETPTVYIWYPATNSLLALTLCMRIGSIPATRFAAGGVSILPVVKHTSAASASVWLLRAAAALLLDPQTISFSRIPKQTKNHQHC